MPQTLAGAIRTLLLEAHGVNLAEFGEYVKKSGSFDQALHGFGERVSMLGEVTVNGPWLCKNGEVLFPIPANLKLIKQKPQSATTDRIIRLDPLQTPPRDWQSKESGMLPLWYHGRESTKPFPECYLTSNGIRAYLEGGEPEIKDVIYPEDLYTIDRRVGIGIDEKLNSAKESLIYTAGMLSLKPEVSFCAEIRGDSQIINPLNQSGLLMKFGGEGKCVEISKYTGTICPNMGDRHGDGNLLVLTTPAWFDGWKPRKLPCIAAAVSGYDGISGWDLASRGPKPNRFMVRAGSVYFLPGNEDFSGGLVEHDDALIGWGHYLKGTWRYVR